MVAFATHSSLPAQTLERPNNWRRRGLLDRDPWIEGYEAQTARLARTTNPYRGADSRRLWDEGWMEQDREARVNRDS